ncbi:Asp-tRNA(Asn)/Glu-tRNA(Gln) amidotransferase subunit GatB [Patescibacteria group bacterium]
MYEPVIGLEIHVQLKTKSKMFCGCMVHDKAVSPNTNICPVCMGHPGVLPVPNEQAIKWATLIGQALNCSISPISKFDRKNYFYPDLPKAYQISQFDKPVAENGYLEIEVPGGKIRQRAKIGITRAHLEEDAAKSTHDASGNSYVDFNRGGTPLVEIVTEPDFTTALEAKLFLQELRLILRYLEVSDADMEKGHLRCDANISLRERGDDGQVIGPQFHPKTEIKNLNSFKHVERAIEYEIKRQTKLWQTDSPPAISTTRGWNDAKQITEQQRTKEAVDDYRYFPEPDIPVLELTKIAEEMKSHLPELPTAKRFRFVNEYALRTEDAKQICEDLALADYTEEVFSELHAWLQALPELDGVEEEIWEKERGKFAKLVAGWLLTKLGGLMAERSIDIRTIKITPENFAEFITLIATGKLSGQAGLTVLGEMLESGIDPSHVMEDKKLGKMDDESELAEIISNLIENHPKELLRYKQGEKQLLQFFIGLIMKETQGTADPGVTTNILKVKLEN